MVAQPPARPPVRWPGTCHRPSIHPTIAPCPAPAPALFHVKHPQYNPAFPNDPLSDAEIDQLDRLLGALPGDEVMDVEALDGYLTGLLISPTLPPPDAWIPRIWGGDADSEPPFVSGKQTKRCVQMVLRHMAAIDRQLQGDFSQFEPWFGIAETSDGEEWVDAQVWCSGFLLALDLCGEQWEGHWDEPEVALALRPIGLLGGADLEPDEAALIETPAQRDEWSRQVPDAVEALLRHWRPAADDADAEPSAEPGAPAAGATDPATGDTPA